MASSLSRSGRTDDRGRGPPGLTKDGPLGSFDEGPEPCNDAFTGEPTVGDGDGDGVGPTSCSPR